jgi:GH15 family glucan-1,4-alpha-glucosidase
MNVFTPSLIAYPPIAHHGVIGDRRTAALVANDGTLDWFCAPDFDGPPIFGSLLDVSRGGYCRWGPRTASPGRQQYLPDTAAVVTTWPEVPGVELADLMAWPSDERAEELRKQRVIIRRLRATKKTSVVFELFPRYAFAEAPEPAIRCENRTVFSFEGGYLGFWSSFPTEANAEGASATLHLLEGDEHWVVLGWKITLGGWSATREAEQFWQAENYWRDWSGNLLSQSGGARAPALKRAALTVQLLSHANHDCAAAAVTTSLPERLGGERNYDYRYAWVRDASLSLAYLARMGKCDEIEHYLDWLCGLHSATEPPLQVCYRLNGDLHLDQEDVPGISGYDGSLPVRNGNRAAKQRQLGSLGFFADCARIYLENGGRWREEFWKLLKRVADFTCAHWQETDSGVWELAEEAHYVASRVMSWAVLDRATYIAGRTGHLPETDHWEQTAAAIHAEVMDKGWCQEKQAFRQRYGSDALDAAALLIPLMGFLPADHPRVMATLGALEGELVVDGLMHRFDPAQTLGGKQLPIGQFEGAFLPCVFWHAHALAKAGRCDDAEAILKRCESISGEIGLFAEEADPRQGIFLGNTPLLFSHVEYARAAMELDEARTRARCQTEMKNL